MPRLARSLGQSGWAHIVVRGINREDLFFDQEDYNRFFSTTKRYLKEFDAKLVAVCLMSNHVHFLLKAENKIHGEIIKRIAISYANYYNKKYDRVGHVFQDRFKSEPVDDKVYFLKAARYIYQNPQKAGMCKAEDYPYTLVEFEDILKDYFQSKEEFLDFLNASNNDKCLEFDPKGKFKDEDVKRILFELTGNPNPFYIQGIPKESRDDIIRKLKEQGASVRLISRVTGLNRNVIQRA